MLLAIDIGNTNIHLGLWHHTKWRVTWRARAVQSKTPDEYGVLIQDFLRSAGIDCAEVSGVVISCVVPPLTLTFRELVSRYFHTEPILVTSNTRMGINIAIDQPEQAGSDRLANAAAIAALYGGPAIVVDFGTSTNFDVITAQNEYLGGSLAPGIGVTHDALVSRAAMLHKVELQPPPSVIGRNTIHAMQSGLFLGYISLIEGLIRQIKDALGEDPDKIQVIGTGGLASLFQRHIPLIDRVEPELTLNGLRVIYELNTQKNAP